MGEVETPTQRPCLEVLEGRSRGLLFELVRRQVVIGRSPGCDLHVPDAGVSRRHVKLSVLEDGSVQAVDMRSTNGMIINGEKIERVTLHDGDVLRLGPDALLRFTTQPPDPECREARPSPTEPDLDGLEPSEQTRPGWVPSADRQLERTQDDLEQVIVLRRPKLEDLPLSARQIEVGRLVANGLTNAAIAEKLGISHRTVTSHLDHIYGRLGISSRAALTRWIVERGLLEPE